MRSAEGVLEICFFVMLPKDSKWLYPKRKKHLKMLGKIMVARKLMHFNIKRNVWISFGFLSRFLSLVRSLSLFCTSFVDFARRKWKLITASSCNRIVCFCHLNLCSAHARSTIARVHTLYGYVLLWVLAVLQFLLYDEHKVHKWRYFALHSTEIVNVNRISFNRIKYAT